MGKNTPITGREEGVRCTQQGRDGAQLHTQREWGVLRTQERKSGVRYIRETLMDLAQINIAQ